MRFRLALALALAFSIAGCRIVEIQSKILAAVPSPDGKRIAYVYRLEPPGGALADFSFEVAIKQLGDPGAPWEGGEVVWTAEEIHPLYVLWASDTSLEVLLSPGRHRTATIRTPSRAYAVSTRQLKTTLKSEIAGSPEPTMH